MSSSIPPLGTPGRAPKLHRNRFNSAQPLRAVTSIKQRKEKAHMEVSIVFVALIGYLAFREWLRHQRRNLIYRERLAAIEKGVELPPLEQEGRRRAFNVQRILLLAGLIWISLGATAFVTLTALLNYASDATREIPH